MMDVIEKGFYLNDRPDEEGIKTTIVRAISITLVDLNDRPDEEGIKTAVMDILVIRDPFE